MKKLTETLERFIYFKLLHSDFRIFILKVYESLTYQQTFWLLLLFFFFIKRIEDKNRLIYYNMNSGKKCSDIPPDIQKGVAREILKKKKMFEKKNILQINAMSTTYEVLLKSLHKIKKLKKH